MKIKQSMQGMRLRKALIQHLLISGIGEDRKQQEFTTVAK